jgi:hypothetical protein
MQQEREFLAALESVKVWTISGGMLDVHPRRWRTGIERDQGPPVNMRGHKRLDRR